MNIIRNLSGSANNINSGPANNINSGHANETNNSDPDKMKNNNVRSDMSWDDALLWSQKDADEKRTRGTWNQKIIYVIITVIVLIIILYLLYSYYKSKETMETNIMDSMKNPDSHLPVKDIFTPKPATEHNMIKSVTPVTYNTPLNKRKLTENNFVEPSYNSTNRNHRYSYNSTNGYNINKGNNINITPRGTILSPAGKYVPYIERGEQKGFMFYPK